MNYELKIRFEQANKAHELLLEEIKRLEKERRESRRELAHAREAYLLSFTPDTASPAVLESLFKEISFYESRWCPKGGATIYEAVKDFIVLSKILASPVDFKFNDFPLRAYPDSNPDDICKEYMERR